MSHDSHIPANQLHGDLLDGFAISITSPDWSDAKYNILYDPNDPLWNKVKRLGIEELTDGTIGGDGIFDGLMVTVQAHLQREYQEGRITGGDYTKAYIALVGAAMANAVQYVTASEQQHWASIAARVAAINGIVELESTKFKYELLKIEAHKGQAEYTVTKQKLATEDVNFAIATYELEKIRPAKYNGMLIANDTATYNLNTILPTQHAGMVIENNTATYRLSTMLPTEHAGMVIANNTASYRLNTMLPTEHAGMVIANNTASYNLSNILPATWNGLLLDNTRKGIDNNIASFNLASILPAQHAGMLIANDTATFNLNNILPVQEILFNEQGNVQRAQTLHTRRNLDGSVQQIDSKSPINMQAVLQYAQVWAYVRDMHVKWAKLHADVYAVMRTTDESIAPPGGLDGAAASTSSAALAMHMGLGVMSEWGNL